MQDLKVEDLTLAEILGACTGSALAYFFDHLTTPEQDRILAVARKIQFEELSTEECSAVAKDVFETLIKPASEL